MILARDRARMPRGIFVLNVFKNGRRVRRIRERNLVVDRMGVMLPWMVAGDLGPGIAIGKIGIGTDGTAPAPGDVVLTNSFSRALSGATFDGQGAVTFDWSILQGEGNPTTVREFGLLTTNGVLVARKVIAAPIEKDASVKLTGAWTIYW